MKDSGNLTRITIKLGVILDMSSISSALKINVQCRDLPGLDVGGLVVVKVVVVVKLVVFVKVLVVVEAIDGLIKDVRLKNGTQTVESAGMV